MVLRVKPRIALTPKIGNPPARARSGLARSNRYFALGEKASSDEMASDSVVSSVFVETEFTKIAWISSSMLAIPNSDTYEEFVLAISARCSRTNFLIKKVLPTPH
jgi:hypothetical protein